MELIKLIYHLQTISAVIKNFDPIEIKINNPKHEIDRWECKLEIRWDLKIVNQFANLGYHFTNYEIGLVGEHDNDEYFGFLIIIK